MYKRGTISVWITKFPSKYSVPTFPGKELFKYPTVSRQGPYHLFSFLGWLVHRTMMDNDFWFTLTCISTYPLHHLVRGIQVFHFDLVVQCLPWVLEIRMVLHVHLGQLDHSVLVDHLHLCCLWNLLDLLGLWKDEIMKKWYLQTYENTLQEAIKIKSKGPNLNRDKGLDLDPVWDTLLQKRGGAK